MTMMKFTSGSVLNTASLVITVLSLISTNNASNISVTVLPTISTTIKSPEIESLQGCRCVEREYCADGGGAIKPRGVGCPKCPEGLFCCCDFVTTTTTTTTAPEPIPIPVCGIQKTQDVPGFNPSHHHLAAYGEFPWLVRVVDANHNHISSGVLISHDKVLTVAHSLYPNADGVPAYVHLGEWNSAVSVVPHKPVSFPVKGYKTHPDFNYVNLKNDIAVIQLESSYDDMAESSYHNPQIGTACLRGKFNPIKCWLATYGDVSKDNNLPIIHKVSLPLVPQKQCEDTLRSKSILGHAFILDTNSFVCAGGEGYGDACIGQGGSPLTCEGEDGKAILVGLVSWGLTDTCPPPVTSIVLPGIYTNVDSYLDWITS